MSLLRVVGKSREDEALYDRPIGDISGTVLDYQSSPKVGAVEDGGSPNVSFTLTPNFRYEDVILGTHDKTRTVRLTLSDDRFVSDKHGGREQRLGFTYVASMKVLLSRGNTSIHFETKNNALEHLVIGRLEIIGDTDLAAVVVSGIALDIGEVAITARDAQLQFRVGRSARVAVGKATRICRLHLVDPTASFLGPGKSVRASIATASPGSKVSNCLVESIGEKVDGVDIEDVYPFSDGVLSSLGASYQSVFRYQPLLDRKILDDLLVERSVTWSESHERLVLARCTKAELVADARWLTWEMERLDYFTNRWKARALWILKQLGYGLRWQEPLRAWTASMITVLLLYWILGPLQLDISSLGNNVWNALVLWIEVLLLPTGIISLSDRSGNSMLMIDGTGLRLARIATGIPFAALVIAVRARFRLPSFSGAKL